MTGQWTSGGRDYTTQLSNTEYFLSNYSPPFGTLPPFSFSWHAVGEQSNMSSLQKVNHYGNPRGTTKVASWALAIDQPLPWNRFFWYHYMKTTCLFSFCNLFNVFLTEHLLSTFLSPIHSLFAELTNSSIPYSLTVKKRRTLKFTTYCDPGWNTRHIPIVSVSKHFGPIPGVSF